MARIRSIHPGIFTDEDFLEISDAARILLFGLWCEADDQGVFEWKVKTLKARIRPTDNDNVNELLGELEANQFVVRFDVAGKVYGAIKNFRKYQKPKKPVEVHPLPDDMREFVCLADEEDEEKSLRKQKHADQEGRCYYCATPITHYSKRENSLELDHKMPLSRGGADEPENIVATCRTCNRSKGAKTAEEFISERRNGATTNAKTVFANPSADVGDAKDRNFFQREEGGGKRENPPLSPPSAKSRSGGKRGTRLPTGFTVPPDWIADGHTAREKHRLPPANLELEAENFVAYWAAKSGKDATKLDWHATWLTWCRRANASPRQRDGPNGQQTDFLDGEIRQWKHRMNGFNQSGFWLNDQWGPPPGQPGCQVPRELLTGDAA